MANIFTNHGQLILKSQRQEFENLSVIASDLLRTYWENLTYWEKLTSEKWLPSYSIFYFFGRRILVIIFVNFVYKWARQLFSGHHKTSDWFIFSEYFPMVVSIHYGHDALQYFGSIPKWFLSNSKAVNTCKIRKGGKLCLF